MLAYLGNPKISDGPTSNNEMPANMNEDCVMTLLSTILHIFPTIGADNANIKAASAKI